MSCAVAAATVFCAGAVGLSGEDEPKPPVVTRTVVDHLDGESSYSEVSIVGDGEESEAVTSALATSIKLSPTNPARIRVGQPNEVVLGNLTVVAPDASGFTTAYPCDQARPNSSVNNFLKNQTIPNFAAVRADANGDICVYSSTTTHAIWDQVTETTAIPAGNAVRKFDTRAGGAPALPAGSIVELNTGTPGHTIMGNLTVTGPATSGFTTVYPCAQNRPNTSVNNFVGNQTIPNFTAVAADAAGKVCFYVSSPAHLIFDQVVSTTNVAASVPVRKLDTRSGGQLAPGSVRSIRVGANRTVMGNLTVVQPASTGYTTAYPCAEGRPNTSVNNFVPGQTIPNFTTVKADANGDVCFFVTSAAHLLFDQVVETTAVPAHIALRKLDSRDRDETHWGLMTMGNGKPSRWNPCVSAEIGVYANMGSMPGELGRLQLAIERIRTTTGLNVVYKGSTTVIPTNANNRGEPANPPYRVDIERDINVAFTTPQQSDLLPGGGVAGIGGQSSWWHGTGNAWNETYYGFALFSSSVLAGLPANARTAVMMHELGHVMGLAHFEDTRQVMRGTIVNTSTYWGNGDTMGLGATGTRSGCHN